jgi:prepilin-type N-terminal cleavage/methylation domain-containing protein
MFKQIIANYKNKFGFSLLELSIVLSITAVVLTYIMVINIESSEDAKVRATNQKLDLLEKAFANYVATYNSLPCPGNWNDSPFVVNFGSERSSAAATCNPSPDWYYSIAYPNIVMGLVPTKTLQLSDDMAFDAWGRRITYGMIQQCKASSIQNLPGFYSTVTNSRYNAATNFGNSSTCGTGSYAMTIKSTSAGTTISNSAIMILISHGKNGHGAYSYDGGTRITTANTISADEIQNAQLTTSGVTQLNSGVFIQKSANYKNGATYFDDIVRYKTRDRLIMDAQVLNASAVYSSSICSAVSTWIASNSAASNNICGSSTSYTNASVSCRSNDLWILTDQINRLCF